MRMKVTSGQQHTAEGEGGASGTTPRLRTRPGGTRMPGAMAASLGGTREGRSGGEQEPRPGDPELKPQIIRAKCTNNKRYSQKKQKKVDFFFFIHASSLPGRPPANFQLDGSASASQGVLRSGAAGQCWLLAVCASVFSDVCAGGRRPARRTATLSVRRLVRARTSSGRSGQMARSSRRRRLACFARSLASCSGGVRGVARGNGSGVCFIFFFLSFFLLGCAFCEAATDYDDDLPRHMPAPPFGSRKGPNLL